MQVGALIVNDTLDKMEESWKLFQLFPSKEAMCKRKVGGLRMHMLRNVFPVARIPLIGNILCM